MPLLKGKKNIGHNIEVEEAHGKPRDQAVAIALRTAGVPKKGAKDTDETKLVGAARFGGALRLRKMNDTYYVAKMDGTILHGGSYQDVVDWCRKNGVNMAFAKDAVRPVPVEDGAGNTPEEKRIIRLYEDGMSAQAIATQLGKDLAYVKEVLTESGAQRRRGGFSWAKDAVEPVPVEDGLLVPVGNKADADRLRKKFKTTLERSLRLPYGDAERERLFKEAQRLEHLLASSGWDPTERAKDDLSTMVDPIPLSPNGTLPFYQTDGPINDEFPEDKDAWAQPSHSRTTKERIMQGYTGDRRAKDAMTEEEAAAYLRKVLADPKSTSNEKRIAREEWLIAKAAAAEVSRTKDAVLPVDESTRDAVRRYNRGETRTRDFSKRGRDADDIVTAYKGVVTSDEGKILLGGVSKRHESTPFLSKRDAMDWADGVAEENERAGRGRCTSKVVEVKVRRSRAIANDQEHATITRAMYARPVSMPSGERNQPAVAPVPTEDADKPKAHWPENTREVNRLHGELSSKGYAYTGKSRRAAEGRMRVHEYTGPRSNLEGAIFEHASGGASKHAFTKARDASTEDWNPDAGERGMFYGIAKEAKAKKRRAAAKKAAKTRKRNRARDDDAVNPNPNPRVLTSVALPTPEDVEKVYGRKVPMKELGKAFGKAKDVVGVMPTQLNEMRTRVEALQKRRRTPTGVGLTNDAVHWLKAMQKAYEKGDATEFRRVRQFAAEAVAAAKTEIAKDRAHAADAASSPAEDLDRAFRFEIQGDRRSALLHYQRAAAGFTRANDARNAQVARDGEEECRTRLAGSFDNTYVHPQQGRARAYDSESAALRVALERTRAGEDVCLIDKRVMPRRAEARDAFSPSDEIAGARSLSPKADQMSPGARVYHTTGRTGRVVGSSDGKVRVRPDDGADVEEWDLRRTFAKDTSIEMYKGWEISEDVKEDAIVAKKPGKPPLYATNVAQAKRIIDQREAGTATGYQKVMDVEPVALDEHEGFEKLERSLAHRKGVEDPKALAAAIGRKKYGAKGMAAKSAAGRAKDGAWDDQVDIMTKNVKDKVRELKDDGVVGMSRRNLRQIVSTRGITVPPSAFDRLLDEAIQKAGARKFATDEQRRAAGRAKDVTPGEAGIVAARIDALLDEAERSSGARRGSIINTARRLAREKGIKYDWPAWAEKIVTTKDARRRAAY